MAFIAMTALALPPITKAGWEQTGKFPGNHLVDNIEVAQLNDHLLGFYWGRDADSILFNGRVGGGAYAIFKGDEAVVYDTMLVPQQAEWVKKHLQSKYHIKKFTLVMSHGHSDHVVGNYLYEDGPILGHPAARDALLARKDAYEAGTAIKGLPPFKVVLPNIMVEEFQRLYVDETLEVQLIHFSIHSVGHLAVYMPADKSFIAGDMLEDPIYLIRPASITPETNTIELERMLAMDIETIYTNHPYWPTITSGGYDKRFIEYTLAYNNEAMARVNEPGYLSLEPEEFESVSKALAEGVIQWWEPYREAHFDNLANVYAYYHP